MIFIVILGGLAVAIHLTGESLGERYPAYKKYTSILSKATNWVLLIGVIGFVIYTALNPKPAREFEPLPSDIKPPSLDVSIWTPYSIEPKEQSNLYILLPSQKVSKNIVRAWERFDNLKESEITLSLIGYDCDLGRATELIAVNYKNGQYEWFDRPEKKDATSKVDLETVGGSAYLAACFNKLPELVK